MSFPKTVEIEDAQSNGITPKGAWIKEHRTRKGIVYPCACKINVHRVELRTKKNNVVSKQI